MAKKQAVFYVPERVRDIAEKLRKQDDRTLSLGKFLEEAVRYAHPDPGVAFELAEWRSGGEPLQPKVKRSVRHLVDGLINLHEQLCPQADRWTRTAVYGSSFCRYLALRAEYYRLSPEQIEVVGVGISDHRRNPDVSVVRELDGLLQNEDQIVQVIKRFTSGVALGTRVQASIDDARKLVEQTRNSTTPLRWLTVAKSHFADDETKLTPLELCVRLCLEGHHERVRILAKE